MKKLAITILAHPIWTGVGVIIATILGIYAIPERVDPSSRSTEPQNSATPELVLVRLRYFPSQSANAALLKDSLEKAHFKVESHAADVGMEHLRNRDSYITFRSSNKNEAQLIVRACKDKNAISLQPSIGDDVPEGLIHVVLTPGDSSITTKKDEQAVDDAPR